MLNPLDRLVRDVDNLKKQVAGRSQLNHSSLENTSIPVYDGDGTERLRIGAQDDGTHAVVYVQGPPPPRPTAPIVSVDGPVVRVRWDGELMGGHIPEDFARIDVHFALASDDLEDPSAVRASLATAAESEATLMATQTGTYRVGLVAVSQSRARSEMSETVEVGVTLVDLAGALDAVVENARGGSNYYSPEPPSGTDHDADRDLWFDTSEDEDGLTRYTPHRWDGQEWVSLGDERVQAIKDAQAEFEQSTSQALTDVQEAASEAQSAADAAADAAGEALSTAETARDEAESKANAAQAAAEAHADAVAEAERLAAIAAASDDATAKAAAAEAAAIAAAALDAKEKADAAQAAAEAKAQAAQDAADAAQSSADDARSRADAAHSAAGSAQDAADAAMQAATHNAKNMWSTESPSGTAPRGTIWFKIDPVTKNVVGQWQQTAGSDTSFGSNWEKRSLTDALFDNIDAGKIGTGYLDVAKLIRAGAIQADKLLIGGDRNLLPNGDLGAGNTAMWPDGAVYATEDPPPGHNRYVDWGVSTRTARLTTFGRFPVTLGDEIVVELWIKADKPGSRVFIEARDQDGAHIAAGQSGNWSPEGWVNGSSQYPVGSAVVPTEWTLWRSRLKITNPDTTEVYLGGFYQNHSAGDIRDAHLFTSGIRLFKRVGATLIENGAITTEKIAAGAITAESGVIGSLDAGKITVGEMNGARIEAGSIESEQLAFGAATGDVLSADALNFKRGVGLDLVSSSFRAGDAVEITEEYGFRQFGPDGALNVDFPSDGSPASVRGDFSARRLSAQQLQLTGATTVGSGADVVIESGVTAPAAAPQVTPYWGRITMPPLTDREQAVGIAWGEGHWWRLVTTSVPLAEGGRTRIEKISPDGQLVDTVTTTYRTNANGITYLNGELYVLAAALSVSGDGTTPTRPRMVVVYGTDGVERRRWEYEYYGSGTYEPGIGTNGTDIVTGQCLAQSGELRLRRFSPTGALLETLDTGRPVRSDIGGVYIGPADFGTQKLVVAKKLPSGSRLKQITTYDMPGSNYSEDLSWYTPNRETPVALAWDGTHFWSLTSGGGLVRYASRQGTARVIGDDSPDWWLAASWRDSPAESMVGPAARFAWPHRSELLVTVPDIPKGVTGVAFFVARQDEEPVRTDLHWAAEINQAARTVIIPYLPSNWGGLRPPVGVSSFTDQQPGELRSALGNFRVDGMGAGAWGPLTFHQDGTMTGIPAVASGSVVIYPTSAGATTAVTVTLPAGRFTQPPIVVASAHAGSLSQIEGVSAFNTTAATVDLYLRRTSTTGTTVNWIAMERP